jgi:hypothetical protein
MRIRDVRYTERRLIDALSQVGFPKVHALQGFRGLVK